MQRTLPALTALLLTATTAFALEMSDLDTNSDGVLNVEEFVAGYADTDPAVFSVIDVNQDGLIDPAEYETAISTGGVLNAG